MTYDINGVYRTRSISQGVLSLCFKQNDVRKPQKVKMIATLEAVGMFLLYIKWDFCIGISTRVPELICPRDREKPDVGILSFSVASVVISFD
ncbi:hypothetical protein D3C81_984600 [compost metagenome]